MILIAIEIKSSKKTTEEIYTELIKILNDPYNAIRLPKSHRSMWFFMKDAVIKITMIKEDPQSRVRIEILTKLKKAPRMVGMVIDALMQIEAGISNVSVYYNRMHEWW
jgi:hypothetical protein